jgi:hypothetical protein
MLGDGFPAAIDIGFPFTYYGQTSTNVLASLNGGLLFGVTEGYLPGESMPLPDASLGAAILPYWTTIYYPQPEDGNEYFATLGEAPNRRFVLEWVNVPILVGGIHEDGATFEVVLFEGSNEILFQYADTNVGDPARDDGLGLGPAALDEEGRADSLGREPVQDAGRPVRRLVAPVGVLGVEGQRDPEGHLDSRLRYLSMPVTTIPRVKKRWNIRNAMTGMMRVSSVPAWMRLGSR